MQLRLAMMFGFIAFASGCSGTAIVNALSPSSHYDRMGDLRYAPGARGTIDLYIPKDAAADAPLVVFIYGGGWKDGSKKQYRFVASSLTREGFLVAIPDYRLYPEIVFPTFVEDAAAAIRHIRSHLRTAGHSPSATVLMGHSAGAHIAALLALDRSYLAGTDMPVAALVGLAGPYDFLPLDSGYLEDVFPETLRPASQPVNFVRNDAPPALLLHGAKDAVVRPENSERLARRLRDAGVPVTLRIYEKKDHAGLAAELAPPLDFLGSVLEDVVLFLRSSTVKPQPVTASSP